MADDTALQSCLVWLMVLVAVTGLYTHSFAKMFATYLFGVFGIGGIFLPHWDFFDRQISQWGSPVCVDELVISSVYPNPKTPTRFKIYPIRLVVYIAVYGFAFYSWWMIISN